MIINAIGGGGNSGGLNLDVISSTTRPTDPTENTIWINTDIELGRVLLQPMTPTEVAEGDVWINTAINYRSVGQSVIVTQFNIPVMEDPYLTICVNTVLQYNGSEWIRPDVEVFIGGEWRPKALYLFDHGTYSSLGNFGLFANYSSTKVYYQPSGYYDEETCIRVDSYNNIYLYNNISGSSSILRSSTLSMISPKVRISEFNTLKVVGHQGSPSSYTPYLYILKAKGDAPTYYTDSDTDRYYVWHFSTNRSYDLEINISRYEGDAFIALQYGYSTAIKYSPATSTEYGLSLSYMALY